MNELKKLFNANTKYLLNTFISWLYILFVFIGVFFFSNLPILLGIKQLEYISSSYMYHFMIILVTLSMFMSVTMNERITCFIPSVIITKLKNYKYYLIGQFTSYYFISILFSNIGIIISNLVLKLNKFDLNWIYCIKYLIILNISLGFLISFIIFLYVIINKSVFVFISVIIYIFLTINFNSIYLSIIVPIRTFEYYLNYKFLDFLFSRILFLLLGIFLLFISIKLYNKKIMA